MGGRAAYTLATALFVGLAGVFGWFGFLFRWLPEAAANAVLHGASPAATALSAGTALAVLAGYAAVLAGAGAALTVRREIGTTTG
jgi:hypothetical protein